MSTRAECEAALRIYGEALLAFQNVVGVGILPLADDAAGRGFAVAITVSRKVPLRELDEDEILPSHLQVRDAQRTYKVPTLVIEAPGGRRAAP